MDAHTAVNRRLWDELAALHAASLHYDVESFLAGTSTLGDLEVGEVGDVAGRRLLHLMCHFGQDTMSWARLGAEVTGVDFSAEAVGIARDLAARSDIEARFVCTDVLEAADQLDATYDVVFMSKGVMMWIQDLSVWARVCARLLRPGGVFYLLDYHPLALAVTQTEDGLRAHRSYFHTDDPAVVVADGSYAVPDAVLENKESREWTHTLGDIVTSLVQAGVAIEFLHEFPAADAYLMPVPQLDTGAARHELPAMFSVRGIRT
jgi:2-polyprenyl-3-methyl-5-hydroxy-6-metoxy-1,4-benzoquinol methylase